MEKHYLVVAAEGARAAFEDQLAGLCYTRLAEWRYAFAKKFPRFHGTIVFGNGAWVLSYENAKFEAGLPRSIGATDIERFRCLATLLDALDDVSAITEGFTLSCPDDFNF